MKKKTFDSEAANPFDDVMSPASADQQLYGAVNLDGVSEQVVGYPVDIFKLVADRTQPRRAVPLSIRQGWNGNAKDVPDLLLQWRFGAENELNTLIPISDILEGRETELVVDPKTQPVADKFMTLLYLAAGIRRDGLLNPIRIERFGDGGMIIMGERRWLAHHLLRMYEEDDKWASIAAIDSQKMDVWAQAQENGNRSPLNAIEMARQLALLIMDMYKDDRGVTFDQWEALVTPGGCDRRFYAQVADGNLYRVKRGFMDRVLAATGLKSRAQVRQYRDLLNLDDHDWVHADEKNWSEGRCRRILHPEQFTQKTGDTSTIVNISDKNGSNDADSPPIEDLSPTHDLAVSPPTPSDLKWVSVGEGYTPPSGTDVPGGFPKTSSPDIDDETPYTSPSGTDVPGGFEKVPIPDDIATAPPSNSPSASQGETSGQRPHPFEFDDDDQMRLSRTDDGEQVAFIAMYERLNRLLNHVDAMGRNLNMDKHVAGLGRVKLWTPEIIRNLVRAGGTEAVTHEFELVNRSIDAILNGFIDELEEMKADVMVIVMQEVENDTDTRM